MIIDELQKILANKFTLIKSANKIDGLYFIYSLAIKTENSIIITKSTFIPSLKKLKSCKLKISTDTSFDLILKCNIDNIFVINRRFNRFEYGFLKNLEKTIVAVYCDPIDYDMILTKDQNIYNLCGMAFLIQKFEIIEDGE